MADEVYRPVKRRIRPEDLQQENVAEQNLETLQQVQSIHRSVAAEAAPDFAPVEMKGQIPPGMRDILNNMNNEAEEGDDEEFQMPAMPRRQSRPRKSGQRTQMREPTVGVSDQFQHLLDRLKPSTHHFTPIELPSMGKFYDGTDGPVNGVLHVRPMTGEEEQILATSRFVKKGRAIDMIFKNCVREPINPEKLLTLDRNFLLIYLRGISYGTKYEVEVKCPECGQRFATEVDLDTLDVEECPDDFDMDSLVDTLPVSNFQFCYRLSRGEDEALVQQYRDKKIKNFTDASDDTLAYRTSLLLQEIEGLTDRRQIQALHKQLPIADVTYIRNMINEPPFGVNTKVDMDCQMCFHEFSVDLPLEYNFFFPKQKKKTPASN